MGGRLRQEGAQYSRFERRQRNVEPGALYEPRFRRPDQVRISLPPCGSVFVYCRNGFTYGHFSELPTQAVDNSVRNDRVTCRKSPWIKAKRGIARILTNRFFDLTFIALGVRPPGWHARHPSWSNGFSAISGSCEENAVPGTPALGVGAGPRLRTRIVGASPEKGCRTGVLLG